MFAIAVFTTILCASFRPSHGSHMTRAPYCVSALGPSRYRASPRVDLTPVFRYNRIQTETRRDDGHGRNRTPLDRAQLASVVSMTSEPEQRPRRMTCWNCPRYTRTDRRCLEGKANPRRKSDSFTVAEMLGIRALCHYNLYRDRLAMRMYFPTAPETIRASARRRRRRRSAAHTSEESADMTTADAVDNSLDRSRE